MQAIEDHPVRFGELAGPLLDGARLFDYQLVATQAVTAAAGHPFREIVAGGGIPYAPVDVRCSVSRYPTFEDTLTVDVVPRSVGETSLELGYTVRADGEPLSRARIVHVTIDPDGGAAPIPEPARAAYADMQADRDPPEGPNDPDDPAGGADRYPTVEHAVDIRTPHIENSQLAYFEEYPRFAGVALEEFLDSRGAPLELTGERVPFKLRDWHWEFRSPVPYGATLSVTCDVTAVEPDTLRVAHTFATDGETRIAGTTEYGCFDRDGAPAAFPEGTLAPFRPE